jgi:hypothetical protein
MKPNFWLTVVCWTLVCLLLSLSQQAGLYHSLQVSGSSQWLDQCREPASGSRTASVFKSTQFDPARAGPFTSLVLEDAWTDGNIGPPGPGKPWATGTDQNLPVAGQRRQLKARTGRLPQEIMTPVYEI